MFIQCVEWKICITLNAIIGENIYNKRTILLFDGQLQNMKHYSHIMLFERFVIDISINFVIYIRRLDAIYACGGCILDAVAGCWLGGQN